MPGEFERFGQSLLQAAEGLAEFRNRTEESAQAGKQLSKEQKEAAREQRRRRRENVASIRRGLSSAPAKVLGQAAFDAARGRGDFGGNVTDGALGLLSQFGVGADAREASNRAIGRVGEVTTAIARATGRPVSDEFRNRMVEIYQFQENAVQEEMISLERLGKRVRVQNAVESEGLLNDVTGAIQDSAAGQATLRAINEIKNKVKNMMGGGR